MNTGDGVSMAAIAWVRLFHYGRLFCTHAAARPRIVITAVSILTCGLALPIQYFAAARHAAFAASRLSRYTSFLTLSALISPIAAHAHCPLPFIASRHHATGLA